MNSKTILGISLAAVLAIAIVFPVAEAITSIKKTEVKVKNGEISKLRFQLNGPVETQPFGGYAIFANTPNTAIAITSHAGFYDSIKQTAPSAVNTVIDFPGPAALCSTTGPQCGPEWHVHIVEYVPDARCAIAAVGELTWNDPSNRLNIAGQNLIARGIPLGVNQYTEALDDDGIRGFDAGTVPGTAGAAFDLTPIFSNPNDPTTLQVVCIGPLA